MADIFTLGIAVDSRPVGQAADNLDRLATSGAKTESVVGRLTRSAREFGQGFKSGVRDGLREFTAGTNGVAAAQRDASGRFAAVTKQVREQGSAFEGVSGTIRKYASVLASVFAIREVASFAKSVIESADAYSTLSSRLLLATGSSEKFATAQAALSDIANKTRTGLTETVDLFASLTRSTESLGVSQKDVLGVTETINKAMAVSGTSAASAAAALTQLGQAFASGALRGDELNSILEQSPRLAQAIADGMGVSVGALRELGAQGKLTAEEVFKAMRTSADAVNQEFARMPLTVGGATTQVKNAIFELIGEFDNGSEASKVLAGAVSDVATEIRGVTAEVHRLADDGTLAGWIDSTKDGFNQIVESLQLVKSVLATLETGGIMEAIRVAREGAENVTKTGDAALRREMESQLSGLDDASKPSAPKPSRRLSAGGSGGRKGGASSAAAERKAAMDAELSVIQRGLREITSAYGAAEAIVEAQRSAGLISESEYYRKKRGFINLTSEAQLKALGDENARLAAEKSAGAERIKNQDKIADNEAKMNEIRLQSESSIRVLTIQQTSANAAVAKSFEEARQAAQSYLDTLALQQRRELEGMGMGQGFRDANAARNQIDDRYQAQRAELENNRALMQMEGKWTAESQLQYDRRLEIIRTFHAKARESYDAYLDHRREREEDWTLGLQEGLNNYLENARNVYKQTSDAVGNALQGMEDALVSFVTTGKADFRSLADSILANIARIQIQQMLTGGGKGGGLIDMIGGALASVVGGAIGGAIGGGGGAGLGTAMVPGMTSADDWMLAGMAAAPKGFTPNMSGQAASAVAFTINSEVNASPGTNVAELSSYLDQRDTQLKTDISESMRRGRWDTVR